MASDKMTAEDRALDRFAEMMIDKISSMQKSEWQKPWFTEGAMRWPRNLSGREYSGQNALMLMLHCEKEGYKIPVFCTFHRVVGLNFGPDKKPLTDAEGNRLPQVTVRKGEKAFPVFLTSFTVVNKETKEKIPYEDYKKLSASEKQGYNVYPKLNVYNVFAVEQTNLAEARPELYAKIVAENQNAREAKDMGADFTFAPLDAMIQHDLWVCPIKPTYGDQAYYSISKDEIVIPEQRQFKDGQAFATNCFHEMAHSTGAATRLGRLKEGSKFGSDEYAAEELRAELTAALTASRYGMTKHIKTDSAAYLKAWLDHIQQDPKFLKTVLADVKRASGMLTHQIDRVQDRLTEMQAAGIQYHCGDGELRLTSWNEHPDGSLTSPGHTGPAALPADEQPAVSFTFDPRNPFVDLRPSAQVLDPVLTPQVDTAPFKQAETQSAERVPAEPVLQEEEAVAKSTFHR